MGCFLGQKPKKNSKPDHISDEPETSSSTTSSFKSRVRAIQNAQWFINSNPKLRSSHPSYSRSTTHASSAGLATAPASPAQLPLGGRTRSTTEHTSPVFDVDKAFNARPMLLPSPDPSPNRSGYPLPLPQELPMGASPQISPSPPFVSPKVSPPPIGNQSSNMVPGVDVGNILLSDLQPLPPPRLEPLRGIRSFALGELATACLNFSADCVVGDGGASPTYTGVIKLSGKAEEVTIMQLSQVHPQSCREWLAGLSTLARPHGSHLCKLLGFCADGSITEPILVYEKLQRGSLHNLLFGADSRPLDWPTRMKIAYGAIQGLATLYEKHAEQVLYRDFRTSCIQVDADYSSKVAGYCFFSGGEAENPITSLGNGRADAYLAPETLQRGHVCPMSTVWSLGIVLLELLTGRQNMDHQAAKEERNLMKWAKPFLVDEKSLFLIMDPKLQGRFPSKGVKAIAELVLQCLQKDATRRPSIRKVLNVVKSVQEMRYTIRFPLKEPTRTADLAAASTSPILGLSSFHPSRSLKMVSRTSLLETPAYDHQRPATSTKLDLTRSPPGLRPPTKFDLIESPPLRPLIIPRRSCATSFAMEGGMVVHHEYSSAPLERVQGF